MTRCSNYRKLALSIAIAAVIGTNLAAANPTWLNPIDVGTRASAPPRTAPISVAPNSFEIGTDYAGWTTVYLGPPIADHGPGNTGGATYQLAYMVGPDGQYKHCGYVVVGILHASHATPSTKCYAAWPKDNAPGFLSYFRSTFTNGDISHGVGDGSPATLNFHNPGCSTTTGFGNVDPWQPAHEIQTNPVPIPTNAGTSTVMWRYVTRSGQFVMARVPHQAANQPNWIFFQRACLSHVLVG